MNKGKHFLVQLKLKIKFDGLKQLFRIFKTNNNTEDMKMQALLTLF